MCLSTGTSDVSSCHYANETNATSTCSYSPCCCITALSVPCSQIIDGASYNSSVDWFSFGVVLYEMIVGRLPFDGFDEQEMFQRICLEEPKYPRVIQADAQSCIMLV